MSRTKQLQIRVTPAERARLKSLAAQAGQGVSAYVLSRALPKARLRFEELVAALGEAEDRRFALAELNELLTRLSRDKFLDAIGTPPVLDQSAYWENYLAAMIELSAQQKGVSPPRWLGDIEALTEPHFVPPLKSLRLHLHLMRASPVPFRRRNIFIDSTIGDRV